MAGFFAFIAFLFSAGALWLALIDLPSRLHYVAGAVLGTVLGILLTRAAIIGKLPAWFRAFLDSG